LVAPIAANDDFFAYEDASRRDMLWSLFGPSLTQSLPECSSNIFNSAPLDIRTLLPQLDVAALWARAPWPVKFHSPRLGFCFEQLWHTALTTAGIEHLANLQIQQQQRTLGELDLIIPERNLHIELAVKFYLGVHDDWIGPNRRDLLSHKLSHTQVRQLPMGMRAQEMGLLPQLSGPVQSLAVMRGCLFHPAHEIKVAPLPPAIQPDHWRGVWCPADRLELLPDDDWFVLSKPDWLSPVASQFTISTKELRHYLECYFKVVRTPLSVARMRPVGSGQSPTTNGADAANKFGETERWMIVPAGWEDEARL
jgi:hypothetical protein